MQKYFKVLDKIALTKLVVFSVIISLCFIASSFAFFEIVRFILQYGGGMLFGSSFQALDHIKRTLPTILLLSGVVYYTTLVYRLFFYEEERGSKLVVPGAIALISIGGVSFIYLIVGYITRLYKFVEGYPTLLYPLDLVLLALFFIASGILLIVFKKKVVTLGIPLVKKETIKPGMKVLRFANFMIAYLFATYALFGVLMSGTIFDLRVSPGWTVNFVLMNLVLVLYFIYHFVVESFINDEYKQKANFIVAFTFFILCVILETINVVILVLNPNIMSLAANPYLLFDFTASKNISFHIYIVAMLAPALIAVIHNRPRKGEK